MRFGYVLLALVTLTSIHTSNANNVVGRFDARCGASCCCAEGRCSTGLAGVQHDDICCDDGCGQCGGSGCSRLPGGSSNCCTSKIRDSGVMCSNTQGAPCIVKSNAVCNKGYPGVQRDDICCDATCGTCGGPGCSSRPGGSDGCCSSVIRASDRMCDTTQAGPCLMDDPTFSPTFAPTDAGSTLAPTNAPTGTSIAPPTPSPVSTCSNGLPGFEDGPICCELQCGTCGGSGCSGRPGGEAGCCSNAINRSEVLCSEALAAPCIIDN